MTIIRGATTIERNKIKEMQVAVLDMYDKIIERNNIDLSKIACIIFVCTKDLTCGNPATLLRINREKISTIPLMCLAHHEYKNALKKCIRIMLISNDEIKQPNHVYLNNAQKLREDLNDKHSN